MTGLSKYLNEIKLTFLMKNLTSMKQNSLRINLTLFKVARVVNLKLVFRD